MEKWYLVENRLDLKEALVAAKVAFVETKVHEPRYIEGPAFAESEKERFFEILGIPFSRFKEFETAQENLFLLVEKDKYEVILENNRGMVAWPLIMPVLEEFAKILETNINVSNPHGEPTEPKNEDGTLFIRFYSAPRRLGETRLGKAFGLSLIDGQGDAIKATGDGIPVIDDEGQVVAEICGGTLYVLFDLPHRDSFAASIMRSIMTKYALLRVSPEEFDRLSTELAERELDTSRKAYVRECGRRYQSTIISLKSELRALPKAVKNAQQFIVESERREKEIRKSLDYFLSDSFKAGDKFLAEFDKLVAMPGVLKVIVDQEGLISVFTDQIDIRYRGVTYDIGKFQIKIFTEGSRSGGVRCYNLTRHVGGLAHPHIRGDGDCCLGNISDGVENLIGSNEYSLLVQLMLSFLGTVNQGGWYASVTNWPKKESK